jgi:uncharacterized membrane protein
MDTNQSQSDPVTSQAASEQPLGAHTSDTKTVSTLAYLFGFISGIIVLLIRKEAGVKFHAWQSILLGAAMFILNLLLVTLGMEMFSGLISLGGFVIYVLLIMRTYTGQKWVLPIIGEQAEKLAQKA